MTTERDGITRNGLSYSAATKLYGSHYVNMCMYPIQQGVNVHDPGQYWSDANSMPHANIGVGDLAGVERWWEPKLTDSIVGFFIGNSDDFAAEFTYESTERVVEDEGPAVADYSDGYYSLAACQSSCSHAVNCMSFSYSPNEGHCYLKALAVTPFMPMVSPSDRRASFKSYYKAVKYHALDRVVSDEGASVGDHDGHTYSLSMCKSMCSANPECKSFSYSQDKGQCFLKAKCVTGSDPLIGTDQKQSFRTYYTACASDLTFVHDKNTCGSLPLHNEGFKRSPWLNDLVLPNIIPGGSFPPKPKPLPPSPGPGPPLPSGVMKGIGYAPVPMKDIGTVPHDDFFNTAAEPLWGPSGRYDLRILQSLGANTVRLYGNDPRYTHVDFFNEAQRLGIDVIVGFSDWPYSQMPGSCVTTGFDCYQQVKDMYKIMLNGLLVPGTKQYHPAVKYLDLINEPDQKFGSSGDKMIMSAMEAVIDVEQEVGVEGAKPQMTATFTSGVYGNTCGPQSSMPALGQMAQLDCAIRDPERFNYKPRHNLVSIYDLRFVNSFNTQNTPSESSTIQDFIQHYKEYFGQNPKPVFIGEYHRLANEGGQAQKDLQEVLAIAADSSNPLLGVTFFEFQVRYDKSDTKERGFGIFSLGSKQMGTVPLEMPDGSWKQFPVYCLEDVWDSPSNEAVSDAVARAFGSFGWDRSLLCPKQEMHYTTVV